MSTREAVGFDPEELLELEMILVDEDAEAALAFLKRAVWIKIQRARQGRLKSHLDQRETSPVEEFEQIAKKKSD